jgi:hypothetical protein
MKITTEDCIQFLCTSRHGGKPGDWKRVNKYKTDSGPVRTFQNRKTGTSVSVWEAGGHLYLESPKPGSGFLIAFVRVQGMNGTEDWNVYVTSQAYWKKHKCCDDNSPPEVFEPFRAADLHECMESCFESGGRFTQEEPNRSSRPWVSSTILLFRSFVSHVTEMFPF